MITSCYECQKTIHCRGIEPGDRVMCADCSDPPAAERTPRTLEVFWNDMPPGLDGWVFNLKEGDRLIESNPIDAEDLDEAIAKAILATGFVCNDETFEVRDDESRVAAFSR